MKKLFFCTAALLAAISFSTCSDDDETSLTASPDTIAGTWKIVHIEGWDIYDGEKETWSEEYPDENGWYYTLTFDKKGSGIRSEYEGENEIDREIATYSISGNTLTTIPSESSSKSSCEIRKLTESELVLLDIYEESDYSFEETFTFKRIK